MLACGGASWRRLGSDGAWADWLGPVAPFRPANMGLSVDWSASMARHFGRPVKGCALIAGDVRSRGEFVISARGLEGGGIYAVSRAVREGAALTLDLLPDLDTGQVGARLDRPRGKASLSNHLRKALRLDPVRLALLQEFGRPLHGDLAPQIKALPVVHAGPRPLGEMLDWEAPTGGYLLTGCFATGRAAAQGVLRYRALTGRRHTS